MFLRLCGYVSKGMWLCYLRVCGYVSKGMWLCF